VRYPVNLAVGAATLVGAVADGAAGGQVSVVGSKVMVT
jgi:hypothetical protein